MEVECVYCAVRTECLNIFYVNRNLWRVKTFLLHLCSIFRFEYSLLFSSQSDILISYVCHQVPLFLGSGIFFSCMFSLFYLLQDQSLRLILCSFV